MAWNSREENITFCANLQGHAFIDDGETVYDILVQYVYTSGTSRNTVSFHTRSKNGSKCYPEIKGNFKTEPYDETKTSK